MAYVPETSTWEPGTYQFETTDLIQGGPGGTDNIPHEQLGNRTKWLYDNKLARDGSQTMTGGLNIQPSSGDGLQISTPAGVDTVVRLSKLTQTAVAFKAINGGVFTIGVDSASGNTERLRIDAGGNVGIGISPGLYSVGGRTELDINGTSSSLLALGVAGVGRGYLAASASGVELGSSGYTTFATNGAERVRIDTAGNVGIGTTAGASFGKFCVVGGAFDFFANPGEASSVTAFGTRGNVPLVAFANGAERVRIDTSGNVGIGTPSPTGRLDVVNSAGLTALVTRAPAGFDAVLRLAGNGQGVGSTNFDIGQDATSVAYIFNRAATPMYFATSGLERMRIDGAGNVGIGTTSGASFGKFSVVGGGFDFFVNPGEAAAVTAFGTRGNVPLGAYVNGAERLRIDASGNVGIGGSAGSNERLAMFTPNGTRCVARFSQGGQRDWYVGIPGGGPNFVINDATVGVDRFTIDTGGTIYHGTPPVGATGSESVNAAWVRAQGYLVGGSFQQSHATNGYVKLPNGTIFQWGQGTPPSVAHQDWSVSFPIAFPNACLSVVNSDICPSGNGGYENANRVKSFSSSGVTFRQDWIGDSTNGDTKQTTTSWHAIGY